MANHRIARGRIARLLGLALLTVLAACGGGGGGDDAGELGDVPAPLPVYLMLGQSNMVGAGSVAGELPADLARPQGDTLVYVHGDWVPVSPDAYRPYSTLFGPEISFGLARGEQIGIVKVAKGGTTLEEHWKPGGKLYSAALDTIAGASVSRPIRIKGIVWMQGESDAREAAAADAYRANFAATMNGLREIVGEVPIVACRVNPPADAFPYVEEVRAAQMGMRLRSYTWLDCDDLPKVADGLHYSTAGLVTLGERFSKALH